jgi:exodeoxyribonuclease VII small subunit
MSEPEPQTFEELMEALEALTDRLATGDLGIEQAAELYEQAEIIHDSARRRLAEVSERIARLTPGSAPDQIIGKTDSTSQL